MMAVWAGRAFSADSCCGELGTGWEAMSGTQTGTGPRQDEIDRARDLFGLGPRPDRDEILAAWRSAVRLTHPDVVESDRHAAAARLMQRINESRDILLRAAADGLLEPNPGPPPHEPASTSASASPVLLAALEAARTEDVGNGKVRRRPDPADLRESGANPTRAGADTGSRPQISDAAAAYARMPKARARPVPPTRRVYVAREQIHLTNIADTGTAAATHAARGLPWPLLTSAVLVALVIVAALLVVLT